MTLAILVRGKNTLVQLEIFRRADFLFPAGRYFGGTLSEQDVSTLTEGLKLHD